MPLLDNFKSKNLVISGLIFSALTFSLYSLASNQFQFLPIQILLALSWSCLYVGSLRFVLEKNIEKATAAGFLKSSISLAVIFGPIFGELVSQYLGYLACIFGAIFLTLVGFLIFYLTEFKSKLAYEKTS